MQPRCARLFLLPLLFSVSLSLINVLLAFVLGETDSGSLEKLPDNRLPSEDRRTTHQSSAAYAAGAVTSPSETFFPLAMRSETRHR